MLVATLLMVAGITAVAVASHRRGYRLGGVMVLPLLVVYTFRDPMAPAVFAVATAVAWATLWTVREYTLTYGRRVFLAGVVAGVVASVVAAAALAAVVPVPVDYRKAEVVGSIFPGVTAYNFLRIDAERRRRELVGLCLGFVALFGLGVVGLRLVAATGTAFPPVLRLPTSRTVDWLGIETVGRAYPHTVPWWLATSVLFADVVVYEAVRSRYDLRLAGIITIPLLAVFSLRYAQAAAIYVVGASVVFVGMSICHWLTLLYGRNLLAFALVCGLLYGLVVGSFEPAGAPGITIFFVGLFTGLGSYNLHRVAPRNRPASIRLSAGLFVVFHGVLVALVPTPAHGHPLAPGWVAVPFGVVALALAAVELVRLERSRPDAEAFADASVFAELDGVDAHDSPLVDSGGDDG